MYNELRSIRYSQLSDEWHAEITLTVTDNRQAPVAWLAKTLDKAKEMGLQEISVGTFGAYGGLAIKGRLNDVTDKEKFEYNEQQDLRKLLFNENGKVAQALPNMVREHAVESMDRDFVEKFVELRAEYEQQALKLLKENGFDPQESGYRYLLEDTEEN